LKDLGSYSLKINRALWVLVTLLPIIIVPIKGLPDIFNAAKAPILSLGVIYITFHLIKIRELKKTGTNLVLIAYLCCVFIASLFAYKPLLALSGVSSTAGRFEGFLTLFFYAVLFYASKEHMRLTHKNIRFFLCVQAIVALYAIAQFFKIDPLVEYLNYTKGSYATIGNQNFLASWTLLMLVVAVGFYMKYRNHLYVVFPALFFGALLASNTRGAWLALLVVGLASLYFLRFKEIRRYHITAFCSFLLVLLTMNFLSESKIQKRTKTIKSELNINNEWAGSGRALIWKMSFDIIQEHPFFGAGPENLKEALKQTKNKRSHAYGKLTGHTVDKAHNDFLHIAAVSGLPALLLYLLFLALIFKDNIRNIIRTNTKSVIALAVLAYAIQSLFNISVIAVAPLFWVLLGLLASHNDEMWTQEV
jgi:putative inorganic carbon (HCO3(-)) transporter